MHTEILPEKFMSQGYVAELPALITVGLGFDTSSMTYNAMGSKKIKASCQLLKKSPDFNLSG